MKWDHRLTGAFLGTILAITACHRAALAAPPPQASQADDASARSSHKIGFYVGVLGDPSPTILGANAAYNLTDYMRVTVGVGQLSVSTLSDFGAGAETTEASVTTIGAGAKFMVPGWSLTPTVGLHAASVFYTGKKGMLEVGGFKDNGSHVYVSTGLDWQTPAGFNLGLGMNHSFKKDVGNSAYINIGWFFDWLG